MKGLRRFSARPWTEADDNILRALAMIGLSARWIGVQMNRTGAAVRSRIRRLKITLIISDRWPDRASRAPPPAKLSKPPATRWTSSEDDKMLDDGRWKDGRRDRSRAQSHMSRNLFAIAAALQKKREGSRLVELGLKEKNNHGK
jgi:hypothetical protein